MRLTRAARAGAALVAAAGALLLAVCLIIPSGAGNGSAVTEANQRLIAGTERLIVSISRDVSSLTSVTGVPGLDTERWSAEAGQLGEELRKRFIEAREGERRLLDDLQRLNSSVEALRVRVGSAMREEDLHSLREEVAGLLTTMAGRIAAHQAEQGKAAAAAERAVTLRGRTARGLAIAALLMLAAGVFLLAREGLARSTEVSSDSHLAPEDLCPLALRGIRAMVGRQRVGRRADRRAARGAAWTARGVRRGGEGGQGVSGGAGAA